MNGLESAALFLLILGDGASFASAVGARQVQGANETGTGGTPCAIPFEDAIQWPIDPLPDGTPLHLFRPSYMESCVSSFTVNKTLMIQHIVNLQETFEQYYCYYNVAKDAAASDPISYQPELGYTLFQGPLEGQADIEASTSNILENVNASGASLATFWEIQTSFNKLYDAHVILPTLTGVPGAVAGFHLLEVLPERNLKNSTRQIVQDVIHSYDEDGEMELKIVWETADGGTTVEKVETLNGMTPYDFHLALISKPEASLNYPYQSIGARMNGAFRRAKPGGLSVFSFGSWSRPGAILPETFTVAYEDGKEETYYSLLQYDSDATTLYELLNSSPDVNAPGSAWTNFEIAVGSVTAATATDVKRIVPTPKTVPESPPIPKWRSAVYEAGKPYEWDQIINLPEGYDSGRRDFAAFKIEKDYAVLKIQSFNFLQDDQDNLAMIEIWSNFTAAAKAKGVTKAIIDVSRNGGGLIPSGLSLVASMYPYAPYSLFQNQFDITYNEVMLSYHTTVRPVLFNVLRDVALVPDQEYLDSLPVDTIDRMAAANLALFEFCCGGQVQPCPDPTCQELADLGIAINTLANFPSGPQLRAVVEALIAAFRQYNPFNVLGTLKEGDVDQNQIFAVNRGGVLQNLTNQFTLLKEEEYYETVARAFQNQFMFEEYTVLADGQAGSTTCMFTSMVQQLWNNRDKMWNGDLPPTPVTTVSYGGTKDPLDTTLAGFPASVQNVKIEIPIITSGLLYLLELVLPDDIAESVSNANSIYQTSLPVPPYFADGLPSMPVYNFYSNWMKPGALPLQYVKMPPNEHIPQIFTSNSISDNSDLAALYSHAAALGFSYDSGDQPSVVEESGDDEKWTMDLDEETVDKYSFDIITEKTSRQGGNN